MVRNIARAPEKKIIIALLQANKYIPIQFKNVDLPVNLCIDSSGPHLNFMQNNYV